MVVLDLFAGTGALAIEALSRGAARAVLVELDRSALRTMRGNLDALGLGRQEAEIRRADAIAALRDASQLGETYDLVFIDPPYARASVLELDLRELLPGVLGKDARVVLESDRRSALSLPWQPELARRYGDTLITIHRRR
jgi:16S rRNA (guanine966-N2)-methyltransferase